MRLKNFNIAIGSQFFKACSEEPRIRILHLILHNNEMCISDLEHVLDFSQTKTSRHVTYLKNSGILKLRKSDQWVLYSLKEEMVDLVQMIFNLLQKDPTLKADMETFNTLFSNRELAINKLRVTEWPAR